jgi:methylated-DNA-[protein]-cysteine S-methyltransferase
MHLSTRRDNRTSGQALTLAPAEGWFRTPWGDGLVACWRGSLVRVELPPVRDRGVGQREDAATPADSEAARRWVAELEAYFRGERLSWRLDEVGLDSEGMSSFARRTVEVLLSVPAGSTVSYGELAHLAGFPRAARAVGSVMAGNPMPVVIPCHRVIRSDGSLGRYGSDAGWKDRLLTHERLNAEGG